MTVASVKRPGTRWSSPVQRNDTPCREGAGNEPRRDAAMPHPQGSATRANIRASQLRTQERSAAQQVLQALPQGRERGVDGGEGSGVEAYIVSGICACAGCSRSIRRDSSSRTCSAFAARRSQFRTAAPPIASCARSVSGVTASQRQQRALRSQERGMRVVTVTCLALRRRRALSIRRSRPDKSGESMFGSWNPVSRICGTRIHGHASFLKSHSISSLFSDTPRSSTLRARNRGLVSFEFQHSVLLPTRRIPARAGPSGPDAWSAASSP